MRRIKNIAVICYSTYGGGAERATYMWVENMLRLGKKIWWLYASNIDNRKLEHPNLQFVYLPLDEERQHNLRKFLIDNKIDFCYDINPDDVLLLDDFVTIKECECLSGAADHSCYFYPLYTSRPNVYLKRAETFKNIDLVTALSKENVSWFKADGVKNAICMPNYLTFDPSTKDCKRTNISSKELLFVGRLCKLKSPDRIFHVISLLVKNENFKDIHINMLGRFDNTQEEEYLRKLVEELGIQENVTFRSEVNDVEPYFKKAKLLLMASYIEGAPMVINEAKAYGLPTIMFSLPYVPGTKESQGVISIEQDDIQGMTNKIIECLEDVEYYNKLSQAAVESLKELSNETLNKAWTTIFEKLENKEPLDSNIQPIDSLVDTTISLVRLVSCQIAKTLEDKDMTCTIQLQSIESLTENLQTSNHEYERIRKKNSKHLKLCRWLIIYSIIITISWMLSIFLL